MQPRPIQFHPARKRRSAIGDPYRAIGTALSAEEGPAPAKRLSLLEAIEAAPVHMLASAPVDRVRNTPRNFDLGQRIARLEPTVRALAGQRIDVLIDVAPRAMPVRLDPAIFDAILIDLVTNSCAAIPVHGFIILRARRAGRRIWLTVADSGRHRSTPGLACAREALRTAHGRAHARSRPGQGSIVALSLPAVLTMSTGGDAARHVGALTAVA